MLDISIIITAREKFLEKTDFLNHVTSKFMSKLAESMDDRGIDEEILISVQGEKLKDDSDFPDSNAQYDIMLRVNDEPICGELTYDLNDVNDLIDYFVEIVIDILLGDYEVVDFRDLDFDDLSLDELKELNEDFDIEYLPESEGFNLTMEEYNDLEPLSRKIYDYLAKDLLEEPFEAYLDTVNKDNNVNLKARPKYRKDLGLDFDFDIEPVEEPTPNENRDRVEKLNYIVDVYNELGSLIEDYIAGENLNE